MKKFLMKQRKNWVRASLALFALSMVALSTLFLPKLLAGDTVVLDLSLQGQSDGTAISLMVTDTNSEDLKVVLPLPEGVSYQPQSQMTTGVTEDQASHQLVIDWEEGTAKQVTLHLEASQSGVYDFVVQTVRDGAPVSSTLCPVSVVKHPTEESKVEEEERTQSSDAALQNDTPETQTITTGTWGTAPTSFDTTTGIMTVSAGVLAKSLTPGGVDRKQIKELVFENGVSLPTDSSQILQFIALEKLSGPLDTSKSTSMSEMFLSCSSLQSIDVSTWDMSQVTNMNSMFKNTSSLTSLDVSNWDISQVMNMQSMFNGASSLTSLDVSNWNTSQVTTMNSMFNGASSLTSLDTSNWDTSQVIDMSAMFQDASSLVSLDVSTWDTGKIKDFTYMFLRASKLTTLDISNWDTSQATTMYGFFQDASGLTTLDVSNWNTSQVTRMSTMFKGNSRLTNLDVSSWDTSQVTEMKSMFSGASGLTSLDTSKWDTSQVTSVQRMFENTTSLTSLTVGPQSKFDASVALPALATSSAIPTIATWIRTNPETTPPLGFISSDAFMTDYDGSNPGTYVREDRRSLDAQSLTRYINDPKPVKEDFQIEAKDFLGVPIALADITVNTDRVDMQTASTYPVDITTKDNQTKEVTVTVIPKKGADITVKYEDTKGTEIAESVTLSGNVGEDYTTEQKEISGYVFKQVEGNPSGQFTEQAQTVTYIYTTDSLSFNMVPTDIRFNETKISSQKETIQRKDPAWKLVVEDTRLNKKNWRVTAQLAQQFEDSAGNPLVDNILFFRQAGQSDQWISLDSEVPVFDGVSTANQELYDVSWKAEEGPLLQVVPGTVKVGQYTGAITWKLVDAPV